MDFLILFILIACFIVGLGASFYQYLQHRHSEKQKVIFHLDQKVKETEQILEHSLSLNLTKAVSIILEKRVLRLLQQLNHVHSQADTIARIKNQMKKVKQTVDEKITPTYFVPPTNRATSIFLLQNYRTLKRILRDELAENQIELVRFTKEMKQVSYYCDLIIIREKLQTILLFIQQNQIEQAKLLFGRIQQEVNNQKLLETIFREEKYRIENLITQLNEVEESGVMN